MVGSGVTRVSGGMNALSLPLTPMEEARCGATGPGHETQTHDVDDAEHEHTLYFPIIRKEWFSLSKEGTRVFHPKTSHLGILIFLNF